MILFKLIYVDDDLEDLDFFAEALNSIPENSIKKTELTVFNSGKQALPAILNSDAGNSLIVLDINMPGKSGFEILKEIRTHRSPEELPVMMFSTSDDNTSIDLSFELGANLYAIKPDNIKQMMNFIQNAIDLDWEKFRAQRNNFIFNPAKV
ncbi:MAG: hypothetical protein K0S32_4605 [Bacteroidetes bacterium]|jgi:DNA-binding response OmpR family regulator|nr:hypothetical protein [Bacteroidota bacterium]